MWVAYYHVVKIDLKARMCVSGTYGYVLLIYISIRISMYKYISWLCSTDVAPDVAIYTESVYKYKNKYILWFCSTDVARIGVGTTAPRVAVQSGLHKTEDLQQEMQQEFEWEINDKSSHLPGRVVSYFLSV